MKLATLVPLSIVKAKEDDVDLTRNHDLAAEIPEVYLVSEPLTVGDPEKICK
jgi:hypothetical protein